MHSRRFVSAVLLLLGTTLLPGCAVKDPPTVAQIHEQSGTLTRLPLDQAWKAGATAGPIADNWLASFGDPELTALVAEAMANNPDLRVTAARVEQAEQHLEVARSALRPQVSLFGTGGLKMGGGDALQAISLGVSWEPDLWGRLRYGRNAAHANLASMQADYEFGRQSLAATLAKSWFAASETWLQIQAAQEMVTSGQDLLRLEEKRTEVGSGDELSMALARVNLGGLQDALEQVRFAHGQTLRAIELLVGRYPSAELAARRDLPPLPGAIPAGLPMEMLERRPDMIAAERRVASAFNRVGEAKAARLPRIVLKANVAALASEILQLKEDFENPTGGLGGTLLAPIYQGGSLKAQVKIRTLEQKEAVAQYARLALRALGDVENALAAGQSLAGRETMLRQVMTDQQRALELSRIRYRVGSDDLRSVQQQELNVNSARLSLLRVQSEQLAQRANLHLALGGSFEAPPAAATPSATGQP
jgi:outer membrane protein, multidrug efflux system